MRANIVENGIMRSSLLFGFRRAGLYGPTETGALPYWRLFLRNFHYQKAEVDDIQA